MTRLVFSSSTGRRSQRLASGRQCLQPERRSNPGKPGAVQRLQRRWYSFAMGGFGIFMKWRLEDQQIDTGKDAVRILRTLVLLQFLRLVEGKEITLVEGEDGIGRLGRVLLRPANNPDRKLQSGSRRCQNLESIASLLAALQAARFPAAGVDTADLDARLINAVGPQSRRSLVDKDGNITNARSGRSNSGLPRKIEPRSTACRG